MIKAISFVLRIITRKMRKSAMAWNHKSKALATQVIDTI